MPGDRYRNVRMRSSIKCSCGHCFGDDRTDNIVLLNQIRRNPQPCRLADCLIDDKRPGKSSGHSGYSRQRRGDQSRRATLCQYENIAGLLEPVENLSGKLIEFLLILDD